MLLIICNEIFTHILSIQRTYKNLTFSFYEFKKDERIFETSFQIIIINFYPKLLVQNLRY